MPRITRVYTRTGDDGQTGLANGTRVPKDSMRVAAYGTVDELSSHLGVALAIGVVETLRAPLKTIQNELFHLGAELSTPRAESEEQAGPHIEQRHVDRLEALIDRLMANLPPLENFVLPGGSPGAAHLHVARTVCRRAERELVCLGRHEPVSDVAIRYLNRLSDALFVCARHQNAASGADDVLWNSRS